MEKFKLLTNFLSSEENQLLEEFVRNQQPPQKFRVLNGRIIIPDFDADTMEYVQHKWQAKSSDVFVAAYPKTGTTWMCEIIRHVLYQQNEDWLDLARRSPLSLRYPEHGDAKKFSIIDKLPYDRRVLCTHMTPDLMNLDKILAANAKVVFVYRNPKDQIVSFLKFLQTIPLENFEPLKSMIGNGWDKYLDHTLKGDFPMNNKPGEWYPEFLLSWYPYREHKNVYFVSYKDLKKDLVKEVKQIAIFLKTAIDDGRATEIADACRIQNMKKVNEETQCKLETFLRKGEVGGWKNYFTVSQSERIDAIMEKKLKDTDIKFTYN